MSEEVILGAAVALTLAAAVAGALEIRGWTDRASWMEPRKRAGRSQTAPASGRGLSPLVGTILMVAITVVLAAVIYVMVTGLVGEG